MTVASAETVELSGPPSLPRLYAEAVMAPIIPGGDEELPAHRLRLRDVAVNADRVAGYCRVCGFRVRSTAPATYPHVLAFPLHLRLMTDRAFPFSVLGLVHIANRIEVVRPISVGANLDLSVRAEDLRPHRRGRQFDLVTEARLDGEPAWRSRSVYLHRGGDEHGGPGDGTDREEEAGDGLEVSAEWRVSGDVGRRYAAVSGDRNPIHMHALSARLFGFPTAIAHGMWTKARCLAAFEGRVADELSIDAEFRSPLRIPGRARFLSGRRGDRWGFRVEAPDGERVHLVGSIA